MPMLIPIALLIVWLHPPRIVLRRLVGFECSSETHWTTKRRDRRNLTRPYAIYMYVLQSNILNIDLQSLVRGNLGGKKRESCRDGWQRSSPCLQPQRCSGMAVSRNHHWSSNGCTSGKQGISPSWFRASVPVAQWD
jgi:hypothetical protein